MAPAKTLEERLAALTSHQALVDVVLIVIIIAIMVTLSLNGQYKLAYEHIKAKFPRKKSPFDAVMLDPSINQDHDGICEEGGTFHDKTNG
jgi:hypothetical protein